MGTTNVAFQPGTLHKLHKADICWRSYHTFKFRAAACNDILVHSNQLRNLTFAEASDCKTVLKPGSVYPPHMPFTSQVGRDQIFSNGV